MKVEWDNSYSVGNEEIDCEHKVFIKIIARFVELIKEKKSYKFKRNVDELIKYAEFHFVSEENRMFDSDYPDLLNHKKEHEDLLASLKLMEMKLYTDKATVDEFVSFLVNWFLDHTAKTDLKMANYLNKLS